MLVVLLLACADPDTGKDTAGPATAPTSGTAGPGTGTPAGTPAGTTPTGTTTTGSTPTGTTPTGTTPTGTGTEGCGGLTGPTLAPAPDPAVHLAWVFSVGAEHAGTLELALDGVALTSWSAADLHEVPVLGLRPATLHTVGWTLTCGADVRTGELPLETPPLEVPFPDATVLVAGDVGPTLIDVQSPDFADYVAVLHADGTPAWVLETEKVADVRWTGERLVAVERFDVVYWDWLGTEHARYSPDPGPGDVPVDTYGFHHEVFPLDDGFVALSTDSQFVPGYPAGYLPDSPTRVALVEDPLVVEVADDGTIRERVSLLDALDPTRIGWQSLDGAELGLDWGHANAVVVDPDTGDWIVSVRHQGAVVRLRPDGSLVWILGDPGGWESPWADVLLAPIGEPFAWPYHQHAPMLHPSGDGRLVLFDNGNWGRVNPYAGELGGEGNYSRLVEYRVVDGTVEQTWEFVETSTGRMYASALGDADYVGDHVLGVWGFLFAEGGVDNTAAGLGVKSARLIEVDTATGEVVWDLRLNGRAADAPQGWQVHRAQRLDGFYP